MCYCSALRTVSLVQVCPLCHSRGELTQGKCSAGLCPSMGSPEGRRGQTGHNNLAGPDKTAGLQLQDWGDGVK